MATSNSKQRLFEVMGKVNKDFKSKLNEISADMAYRAHDAASRKEADSYNSPYHSEEEHEKAKGQAEKFRLYGMGKDYDENPAAQPEQPLTEKIIGQKPTGKRDDVAYYKGSGAFPKYTHFAVLKDNNKIINGWDYRGYDSEELKSEKKHYFFDDIKDMQFDPKNIKVVTAKFLQKQGIDPFDFANWLPNEEYKNYAIY
jgi:hypothetical protein